VRVYIPQIHTCTTWWSTLLLIRRGGPANWAGRGVHGFCSVLQRIKSAHINEISLSRPYHAPHAPATGHRVTAPGSTAIRRPMQVALAAATHVLANAPGNAHSARPPAAQRRTSFLSHSALSAVSLATASAFSLAVSSARSASSRPTAAACVCAARTAHDWTKA
jgi:hypothetical protein